MGLKGQDQIHKPQNERRTWESSITGKLITTQSRPCKETRGPSISEDRAPGLGEMSHQGGSPGSPMKTVHHLEVDPQVLLGEVIQHACIHQALHEVTAVLREPQAGQPFISNPFVIHVSIGQGLET